MRGQQYKEQANKPASSKKVIFSIINFLTVIFFIFSTVEKPLIMILSQTFFFQIFTLNFCLKFVTRLIQMEQRMNKFQCRFKFGYCIRNGMLQISIISMIWANVRLKSIFTSCTTGVPKHRHL